MKLCGIVLEVKMVYISSCTRLLNFSYTKLFWYDAEQGNNRCLCLSHIFNVILWMGGVFLPHT